MSALSPVCLLLAVSSGVVMTLATLIIAYPEQRARQHSYQRGSCAKRLGFLANFIVVNVSSNLNILAVGRGSIAIVTPLCTGSNLLSNMALQQLLGIATYSGNAVIGTLVLVCAVAMLVDVGPADIDPGQSVTDLLLRPASMLFLCVVVITMIACSCAIKRRWVKNNLYLNFLYAVLGGSSLVLNVALSKVVQLDIPFMAKIPVVVFFFVTAFLLLATGARANSDLEDPSLFTPMICAVNLLLTCLAGLFIWEDGKRITQPLSYTMVYVIVVLGTYLVSKDDLLRPTDYRVAEVHLEKVNSVTSRSSHDSDHRAPLSQQMKHYGEADVCPTALRGRWARVMKLSDQEGLRQCIKSAVTADEHGRDDLIDLYLSGTLGTVNLPALCKWPKDRQGPESFTSENSWALRSASTMTF